VAGPCAMGREASAEDGRDDLDVVAVDELG
jgi:hypothetical protein